MMHGLRVLNIFLLKLIHAIAKLSAAAVIDKSNKIPPEFHSGIISELICKQETSNRV